VIRNGVRNGSMEAITAEGTGRAGRREGRNGGTAEWNISQKVTSVGKRKESRRRNGGMAKRNIAVTAEGKHGHGEREGHSRRDHGGREGIVTVERKGT
jgi:hypothetical protein